MKSWNLKSVKHVKYIINKYYISVKTVGETIFIKLFLFLIVRKAHMHEHTHTHIHTHALRCPVASILQSQVLHWSRAVYPVSTNTEYKHKDTMSRSRKEEIREEAGYQITFVTSAGRRGRMVAVGILGRGPTPSLAEPQRHAALRSSWPCQLLEDMTTTLPCLWRLCSDSK